MVRGIDVATDGSVLNQTSSTTSHYEATTICVRCARSVKGNGKVPLYYKALGRSSSLKAKEKKEAALLVKQKAREAKIAADKVAEEKAKASKVVKKTLDDKGERIAKK
jgi:hypothetical protein